MIPMIRQAVKRSRVHAFTHVRWLAIVLMVVTFAGLDSPSLRSPVLAAAVPNENAGDEARISLIIRPEPSIQVVPGGTIAYRMSVRNTGGSFADEVRVQVSYDPAQLTILGTDFERVGDWITDSAPGMLKLVYAGVGVDKRHTATIYARVADNLPPGTVISLWTLYAWQEGGYEAVNNRGNAAPVLVGEENRTSPWVWMAVDPVKAAPGVQRGFFTDRFVPGEPIKVWLSTPDGLHRRRDLNAEADGNGHLRIHLATDDLQPGYYQLVAQGQRSELVAGAAFLVR